MIGWLFDRWWAWKNRAALRELDEDSAFLRAMQEHIDREMAEAYGPNWREEAEARLERFCGLSPYAIGVGCKIDRSPTRWWKNHLTS